jgi:hypothetical protein
MCWCIESMTSARVDRHVFWVHGRAYRSNRTSDRFDPREMPVETWAHSAMGIRLAHATNMNTSCNKPFFSSAHPFLRNDQGWRIFLKVQRVVPGPLHRFQGAVVVESGQGKPGFVGLVDEVQCPRHHADCTDATRDAIDLAQVVLAVIDTALLTEGSVDVDALAAKLG